MAARASAAAAATLAVLAFGAVSLATSAAGGGAGEPASPSYRAPALVHTGSSTPAVVARKAKAVKGVVLGGLTRQHWPVVIRMAANGKKVAQAVAGMDASTDEYMLLLPDEFANLPVKKGRFGMTWGPQKVDFGGGYIGDCSGEVSGKFSRNRSKVSGIWTYRAVVHDPTGVVVATHDSGVVPWSARQ